MKAVCVEADRTLAVRDVATPTSAAPGHLLVDVAACAINHGDKTFLRATSLSLGPRTNAVWGASGVGRVMAVGEGVPGEYAGKWVAMYRSLRPTAETIGLWCERAQIHHLSCLILPDAVDPEAYCGSLVNAITAYAFLEQATEEGHAAIVATAGASSTALCLASVARARGVPVIHLVRSEDGCEALRRQGVEHVLATTRSDFEDELAALARDLRATAVYDGLGGELVARLATSLPADTTFYFYGFLAGSAPISVPTSLFMFKNLSMKRFSNFQSATVVDSGSLAAALAHLSETIDHPLFRTRIGQRFRFTDIDDAMRFETEPGAKAVLVP